METIGRYRIVAELGRGGMGVVYRALDPVIDRHVALKTIRAADGLSPAAYEQMRERFLREARAAGKLSHPNIVSVLDAGSDEASGVAYIAMEFVCGRDLESEMRAGRRYSAQEAADIVGTLAGALSYAHQHGVVHRDVKPANVLRAEDGTLKITDFGIARLSESALTHTGQILGSPAYMSPEQITGAAIDARSDVFSLGVVFYQLLTGEKPFLGEGLSTLAYQIVHTEPIPPRKLNPTLPAVYEQVVARTLAKDPAQRYASARELHDDLRGGTVVGAAPPAPAPTGTMIEDPSAMAQRRTGTMLEGAPAVAEAAVPDRPDARVRPMASGASTADAARRPGWLVPAAVAFLVVVAAAAVFLLARRDAAPQPGAAAGSRTQLTRNAAVSDAAAAAATRSREAERREANRRPEEAREKRPAVAAVERAEGDARLLIDFEHHLSSGEVVVDVGGQEVWRSPLHARKRDRLSIPGMDRGPSLRLANEKLFQEVAVPSGVQRITVTVASRDSDVQDTAVEQARLSASSGNSLRIRVSRLTRKVSLDVSR